MWKIYRKKVIIQRFRNIHNYPIIVSNYFDFEALKHKTFVVSNKKFLILHISIIIWFWVNVQVARLSTIGVSCEETMPIVFQIIKFCQFIRFFPILKIEILSVYISYADDTVVVVIGNDLAEAQHKLNQALDKVTDRLAFKSVIN